MKSFKHREKNKNLSFIIILLFITLVIFLSGFLKVYLDKNNEESIDLLLEGINNIVLENIEHNEMLDELGNEFIKAKVIYRNLDYFNETVTINKGFKDGVLTGMNVIDENGLIGIIISSHSNYSVVKLITDFGNGEGISIRVNESEGFINSYENGYIYGDILSNDSLINIGDAVYTSNYSEKFINGLYIGNISNIVNEENTTIKKIEIDKRVDLGSINYVLVIGRGL